MSLITSLERIGFLSLYSRRLGPCEQCQETLLTFYIPQSKAWYCESCYYANPENKDFISFMNYELSEGKNMAQQTISKEQFDALMTRLSNVEAENQALKAKSTDNVFVGGTDNLTLKHRQINAKAWGIPTKWSNGTSLFRCSDFPMSFFVDRGKKAVILHTEIPASDREIQLFEDRYLKQNIVVAKRRQQTDGTPATPAQAPSTPTVPTPAAAPVASSTGERSWSSLPKAEQDTIIAEANGIKDILFKGNLTDALKSVLSSRHIVQ